jgi:hypothetical protein
VCVKVPGNTIASVETKEKAQLLRLENEIKYLYKKQQLNWDLLYIHLWNAHIWGGLWDHISNKVMDIISIELKNKKIKQ